MRQIREAKAREKYVLFSLTFKGEISGEKVGVYRLRNSGAIVPLDSPAFPKDISVVKFVRFYGRSFAQRNLMEMFRERGIEIEVD